MIPSKNKRFLGYLVDIWRHLEVIKKAKMNITSNENSIKLVNDFLSKNNSHGEILHILKNNSNSNETKKY